MVAAETVGGTPRRRCSDHLQEYPDCLPKPWVYLIVDDESIFHMLVVDEALNYKLVREGDRFTGETYASSAMKRIRQESFAGILLDGHLPDGDVGELLDEIEKLGLLEKVVVFSTDPEIKKVVEKFGVPFVEKVVKNDYNCCAEAVRTLVERARAAYRINQPKS
ncbi:MAG: response regulator [Candidatus Woesearchaeota archaeon]